MLCCFLISLYVYIIYCFRFCFEEMNSRALDPRIENPKFISVAFRRGGLRKAHEGLVREGPGGPARAWPMKAKGDRSEPGP